MIAKLRKLKQLTQKELAEKSGISKSYISELENHKHEPTMSHIILLSRALDVTPNDLLDWDKFKDMNLDTMKYQKNTGELFK